MAKKKKQAASSTAGRPAGAKAVRVRTKAQRDAVARGRAGGESPAPGVELERRVTERTAAIDRVAAAARECAAQLADILDTAMDAIVSVDERQRIVRVNPAAEQMFGHPAGSLVGRSLDVLIPAAQRQAHRTHVRRFEGGETAHRRIDPVRPVTGLRADGTEFPIEASIARSIVRGRVVSTAILRDVTPRRRAEAALLENEKALADFFAEAPIGLVWVDAEGRIERINRAQLVMMDRVGEELGGRPIAEFHAHPEVIDHLLGRVRQHETVANFRVQIERRDRTLCHVLVDANGVWQGERLIRSRWFVRDVTGRLDLEREILAIAERERERIGHELHDGLCQELLGIEFQCEGLARDLEADSSALAGRVRDIAAEVRKAMERGRELARGLAPPSVESGQGLVESLAALAERTRRVFLRDCIFETEDAPPAVETTVGTHLYRIAQEAVGNAIRHGHASRIEIRLRTCNADLVLGVEDDGCGIPDNLSKTWGLGLRIMQYRAGTINGSVVVQRRSGGGTAIVCTVKPACAQAQPPR
jgi:PAS domain S-box-containing protein